MPNVRLVVSTAVSKRRRASRLSAQLRVAWLPVLAAVLVLLATPARAQNTYTVTNTSASGSGSLAAAVASVDADTGTPGDTIDFATGVTGTITLASTLTLSKNVTLTGPGANLLTISGNNAVTVFTINSGVTASISGVTIANGGGSGGIYNNGTLTVSNSTLSGNTSSSGYGGGINNNNTLTVSNSTFSGNTASIGSGIYNYGTLTVSNSTFSGNTASGFGSSGGNTYGYGGGIYNASGALTVSNSTFSGNTALTGGGGIFVVVVPTPPAAPFPIGPSPTSTPTATITNSIVAGNTTTGNAGDDCDGCTSSGNNLISTPSNILDPKLGTLANNGGPTETMMPLLGSPAIAAGLSSTLSTDQRGFPRPTGNGVASDLGAVQVTYFIVTTTADSTDTSAICDGSDTCSLRDALTLANSQGSADISFASGLKGTIPLGSALPPITATNITLTGPGANVLTVSGGNNSNVGSIFTINSGVTASISGLTIANGNSASVNGGGGIYSQGTLTINNSTLTGNTATANCGSPPNPPCPGTSIPGGGGIANNGTLTINNSTFSGNSAGTGGGGIYNIGTLTINNSTFSGNTTGFGGSGGGILNESTLTVNNSTFSGNSANVGGGINNGPGTVTLTNSIVAGNTDTGAPGSDCYDCTTSGNNLVSVLGNSIDPMLGPLAYNGPNQTVQTLLPLPGSPAIEAGSASTLSTDERGLTRPTGTGVVSDLGAVQTNYTAVQFVQQPTNTLVNAPISPAVTLSVTESGAAAVNIPVPITLSGNGTLAGTLTETTATSGNTAMASYGNLSVNAAGTGDTLDVSLPITPAGAATPLTLTATSNSFDISVLTTTITWTHTPPASVVYGAAPITLAATANSGATVLYQVISGPATISGSTLTLTGAGSVVIEAYTNASSSYAAGSLMASITVTQASQTITWTHTPPASVVYGAAPIPLAATANSGATVLYQVISGPATISGSTLTLTGAGAVVIETYTPANSNYTASSLTASITVTQASQTITWTHTPPTSVVYGAAPIPLAATANFGATVLYQVISGPATISGSTLTLTGAGSVVIEAYTPANSNYTAGSLTASITVTQASQTITFPAIAAKVYGSAAFAVSATSTSSLPVTIAVTSGPATISGNTITLTGAGTVVLAATQTGNANYSAATPVTQSFVISPATTSTTLVAAPTSITAGQSVTFTATVASAAGTPTGTVTFLNGSTPLGTGTLANGVAILTTTTLAAGGDPAFTATYAAQGNYAASVSNTATVTVAVPTTPIPPSYTVTANPSSLTILAGQTATTTLTFTPVGGYTGSLTLSCGNLPANVKCLFFQTYSTHSPVTNNVVTMTGNDAVITVTLTIQTSVATAFNVLPSLLPTPGARAATWQASPSSTPSPMNPILPALAFWGPGSLAGLATFGRKRKLSKKQFGFLQLGLLVLLTGALAAGISGCGGSTNLSPNTSAPAASDISITVAPSAGSGQSSQTIHLNVTIIG